MNSIRETIARALNGGSIHGGSWADQSRLGCKVQGSSRSSDDMIVSALEKAATLSAIDKLAHTQASWLRLSLGPYEPLDHRSVMDALLNGLPIGQMKQDRDSREKHLQLAATVVEDAAIRITSDGARSLPAVLYQIRLKVTQPAFSRLWSKRRDQMLDHLTRYIDTPAIESISRAIRK